MAEENAQSSDNPIVAALDGRHLVLGSKSPRRIELIKQLGIPFDIHPANIDESYPNTLVAKDVPTYLSKQKSLALLPSMTSQDILITADTIVICDNTIIGKPQDRDEAATFLKRLSGRTHQVVSGYTIATQDRSISNHALSAVTFRPLSDDVITHYIDHYEVLDKAGAYGVQDWIGVYAVERIDGSYHNVMGLPTCCLIRDLIDFLAHSPKQSL